MKEDQKLLWNKKGHDELEGVDAYQAFMESKEKKLEKNEPEKDNAPPTTVAATKVANQEAPKNATTAVVYTKAAPPTNTTTSALPQKKISVEKENQADSAIVADQAQKSEPLIITPHADQ